MPQRSLIFISKELLGSRYGSVNDASTTSFLALREVSLDDGDSDEELEEAMAPPFSCQYRNFELHTHAPIKHLLYHLGPTAFVGDNRTNQALTTTNADLWLSLTQKAASEALKKLRVKIPGGKFIKK